VFDITQAFRLIDRPSFAGYFRSDPGPGFAGDRNEELKQVGDALRAKGFSALPTPGK
jgi:hypothetical protein